MFTSHSKITARAPSKVILAGENAVVYGARAIVCGINLMNSCSMVKRHNPLSRIKIGTNAFDFDCGQCLEIYKSTEKICDQHDYNKLLSASSKTPLFWVRCVIGKLIEEGLDIPSFSADLDLSSPLGSGLGGSAITTKLIVESIYSIMDKRITREKLFDLTSLGDRIAHGGTGSATDSSAVVYGGCLSYEAGKEIKRVFLHKPLRLIVCDSGQRKESQKSLSIVEDLRRNYPRKFREYIQKINLLSTKLCKFLENGEKWHLVGNILHQNHLLLKKMGLSTDRIDKMVQLSLGAGAYGAKLTGGGCGGHIIILAKPEAYNDVRKYLNSFGYQIHVVEIVANEEKEDGFR